MRGRPGTVRWSAWLTAVALIAALATAFVLTAPGAEAHNEGEYHQFELRCHPGQDTTATSVTVKEGEDFTLQAKWHDREGVGTWIAYWDTNEMSPVSARQDQDFEPEHDERHNKSRSYSTFNHTFHTKVDDLWEGDEKFKAGYSAIRRSGGTNQHADYCTITLKDDDTLTVRSVRLWGEPSNGSHFKLGETIRLRFQMNGMVHIPNGHTVTLKFTDEDGNTHERNASYNAGLSTEWRPVYDYTLQGGEPKAERISVDQDLGGMVGRETDGTVTSVKPQYGGHESLLTFEQEQGTKTDPAYYGIDATPNVVEVFASPLPDQTDHVITDRRYTRVVSENTYRAGDPIEITALYDQEVDVEGGVGISFRIGDGQGSTWRGANYHRGSGTNVLVFQYIVKPADRDEDGISIDVGASGSGMYGNGTITAAGTAVEARARYSRVADDPGHKVDGQPVVTSTEVISTPVEDSTYWTGETIRVALNYNTEVDVSGSPRVKIYFQSPNQGQGYDPDRAMDYESGSGTKTLVFAYQVKRNDYDEDGLYLWLGTEAKGLSGGTVTAAGTDIEASPYYSSIPDSTLHKVDGKAGNRLPAAVETLEVTSQAGQDSYYNLGESIEIAVTFDEDITVTAPDGGGSQRPTLDVLIGEETVAFTHDPDEGEDNQIVFTYTVQTGDEDTDGISVAANSLEAGDHNITDPDGEDAALAHGALAPDSGDRVDATTPTVQTIGVHSNPAADSTYDTDEIIQIVYQFSEDVNVTGSPQLALDLDGTTVHATFVENLRALVEFKYTVKAGDQDVNGFAVGADAISLNGGTIKDAAGNDADLSHDAQSAWSAHRVDGKSGVPDMTAPTLNSVEFTSTAGEDHVYVTGENIEVTLTFDEEVSVTGSPQLTLQIGDHAKTAAHQSTDGAAVSFTYTVAVGDSDDNGVSVPANSVTLNGGTIADAAGNDAVLDHDAVDGDITLGRVDGKDLTAPTIGSVSFTSDPGPDDHYGLNDVIEATVTFSEDVVVTESDDGHESMPHLDLRLDPLEGETNANIVHMALDSVNGNEITFTYTVVAEDRASDSAAIPANALMLNGATIQDEAGNDAVLRSSLYFPVTAPLYEYHQVDGSRGSDTQTGGV